MNPPLWQLLAVVLATVLFVSALAAVASRLGTPTDHHDILSLESRYPDGQSASKRASMDSGKPTCFLSFPEDPQSAAAADALRADLEARGVTVLPPARDPARDDATASSLNRPFYWLRQADAVVLDVTGYSTWVVYDAGAAQALDKLVIPVAQTIDDRLRIGLQLPRILEYEPGSIAALADYVTSAVMRMLSANL